MKKERKEKGRKRGEEKERKRRKFDEKKGKKRTEGKKKKKKVLKCSQDTKHAERKWSSKREKGHFGAFYLFGLFFSLFKTQRTKNVLKFKKFDDEIQSQKKIVSRFLVTQEQNPPHFLSSSFLYLRSGNTKKIKIFRFPSAKLHFFHFRNSGQILRFCNQFLQIIPFSTSGLLLP